MANSSWQNSGLTYHATPRFADQEETSTLDVIGRDPMSMEWTDEKHSLYITSMEATFVEQLYSSNDSFGWQSRGQGGYVRAPPKVKHSRRADPQPEAYVGHNKHLRGRGKPGLASSSVQHSNFYNHQPLSHAGGLPYYSGYNYVQANYNEEVSDQNFVDGGCGSE